MSTFALALRPLEFFFAQYRRVWRGTVVSSVVTPVVYLLALGVGLGKFVQTSLIFDGHRYDYLDVVAPGLLGATAMQVASFESSWPVLSAIKWSRQYPAMLSAPLRVRDVVVGHQSFIAARIVSTIAVYLVVITAFGAVRSPLAILAIPAAGLVGMSFATPLWHGVDLCRQLTLGDVVGWAALAHVVFLVAWIVAALTLAGITYRRRLG